MSEGKGKGASPGEVVRQKAWPIILPDPYTREEDFTQQLEQFESVATINVWGDDEKLQWLGQCLKERALTAFKQLSATSKASFWVSAGELKEKFKPKHRQELHLINFQWRTKLCGEDWADFVEDLQNLSNKAYPDLPEEAQEHLSQEHFLDQITNPQIAYSVRQASPKTVDEEVACTL